jgi:hypothetical protein
MRFTSSRPGDTPVTDAGTILMDLTTRRIRFVQDVQIPPRGPRGSPVNFTRWNIVDKGMMQAERDWYEHWKLDPGFAQALKLMRILLGPRA